MKLTEVAEEVRLKLKRINAGYYTGEYKGVKFEIHKAEDVGSFKNRWYWKIGNRGGEDHFPKKWIAIEAVKEWVDEEM